MLARGRSRKRSERINKNKYNRGTGTKKNHDIAAQIKVHLNLFSPSKATRWDPYRHDSDTSSSNYTSTMATALDIDEVTREEILADQRGYLMSSDAGSESFTSDLETQIPDWENYVDPYSDFEWLEMIHGEVVFQRNRCSRETRIADCKAYLVRRWQVADTFWDDMEEPKHELAELAFEVFDRFGCLQPKFKDHPIKRGSGVWKDELNNGDILLIGDIRVNRCNRRKGIGSKLTHAILELTAKKSRGFFAVTSPDMTITEVSPDHSRGEQSEKLLINNALKFWRTLGFRRICSSRWLGYTPDRNHPSHKIGPEQDFDLPSSKPSSFTLEMDSLAMALPTIDDTECLTRLKNIFVDIHLDDIIWEARNDNGDTFLHLVSCSSKIESTRWLMHSNPKLCHALNADGSTPLDALEESANQKRRIHQRLDARTDISDLFSGYDQATIFSLALLKGITPERLSEAEISRLKFGCTCESCLCGFLSPRMRNRLILTAEITFDFIYTHGASLDGPAWCEENENLFRYLPEHIIQSFAVNKEMIIGFCMLWNHLISCLRKNMLPTEANILLLVRNTNEWPNHSRNFLQNGGTLSSVATTLFWKTMELEEIYDETYEGLGHGSPHYLPSCQNDREFGLVSGMCGYERVGRVQLETLMGKRVRY
ncbi:uncharacterized protein TRUGW13939_07616 [Talaromyces rugulosus]|uniref:N-acetyltransferase domain-containing protein n=1 Tax=Talaromyces rugulosus TaxID=121627 RepID=A0A7H8R458_TALRU|nr:uncharacterized protein TRUGW13939_07616 [Talaromyces rugulosus]QKX60471.1 hypothetical protein TRUGW13939_07616 [Talaromyces rugulosus]